MSARLVGAHGHAPLSHTNALRQASEKGLKIRVSSWDSLLSLLCCYECWPEIVIVDVQNFVQQ